MYRELGVRGDGVGQEICLYVALARVKYLNDIPVLYIQCIQTPVLLHRPPYQRAMNSAVCMYDAALGQTYDAPTRGVKIACPTVRSAYLTVRI